MFRQFSNAWSDDADHEDENLHEEDTLSADTYDDAEEDEDNDEEEGLTIAHTHWWLGNLD